MTIGPPGVEDRLMAAGALTVRFNSPLGEERAAALAAEVGGDVDAMLDVGCGRGELLMLVCDRHLSVRGLGIDRDVEMISFASARAAELGLDGRVSFTVGDAVEWAGVYDGAMCVGASHALGGTEPALSRLAAFVPDGRVLFAEGFWSRTPDQWCLDTFGPLPAGIDALSRLASSAGWSILDVQRSSLDEWDDFEARWQAGVAGVGSQAANEFSRLRRQQYEQHYRGVLGFAWLLLSR